MADTVHDPGRKVHALSVLPSVDEVSAQAVTAASRIPRSALLVPQRTREVETSTTTPQRLCFTAPARNGDKATTGKILRWSIGYGGRGRGGGRLRGSERTARGVLGSPRQGRPPSSSSQSSTQILGRC